MAALEDIQRLIGEIYDSALTPDKWPTTLARLSDAFAGNAAVFHAKDFREVRTLFMLQVGCCDELLGAYASYYMKTDVRFAAGERLPAGALLYDAMHISEAEMDRCEYYRDFLGRFDMRYSISGVLANDRHVVAAVTVQRSPRTGPVGAQEIEQFSSLVPHFQRALVVQQRLATFRNRVALFLDVLDGLPGGVIVADGQARPVLVNRAADEILRTCDGLMSRPDGLTACRPAETAMLRRLIAESASVALGKPVSADAPLYLGRPSGKRPLIVRIMPTGPSLVRDLALKSPPVLLFVSDPESHPRVVLAQPFVDFYGLTGAETRLLEALLNGLPLEAARRKFGVTMATVRKHLSAIFGKTGTKGQADVVRLVLSNPLHYALFR